MAHTRSYATFWHCVRIIDLIDRAGGTYIRSYWLRSRSYWAASHNRFTLSMGNNTNNRVENSHRQLKRYLKKNDPIEMTVWKIWRWIDHDTQRKHMQGTFMLSKYYRYNIPESLKVMLRRLTLFAERKVVKDYERHRLDDFFENLTTARFKEGYHRFFVDLHLVTCTCWFYCAYRLPCRHIVSTFLSSLLHSDILCNSERWTRSYNVFHELPRVVRQVPEASVEFRNKYQRIRARIAHLNKIDPTRAIQAIDGSQRIVDSLFHEATNSVVRLSHAPTQRRLRLNVPSLMQSKTFSSNFFLYVFFPICNTFQINYFVT
ncbi:hypothetical protein MN116_000010 [Schistosoma mekongi]|uniref:SWIM-type domain-containing protein n=1 Tax=Schistosoma mekongi TaxID=38744 RepID=A0AAE2D4M6_SCHME|nr:hypothetical protein MN116_000010 [Schistosoma mekongi]